MKQIIALTFGALVASGISQQAQAAFDIVNRSEVHFAATYNKPSNNGLVSDFNNLQFTPVGFNLFHQKYTVNNIEPDFEWNYALGASYSIPCSHSRVFVDFERFNDFENQTVAGATTAAVNNGTANERVEMKQYEVRGGYQHYLRFGPQFFLDLSAYLEYDRLSQTLREDIHGGALGGVIPLFGLPDGSNYTQNLLHGFGPGLGIKMLGIPFANTPSFKLFAGLMTSLLYSKQDGSFEYQDSGVIFRQVDFASTNAILSKFNVDFGVDYSKKILFEHQPMLFGLTLGVKYINIVNAIKYNAPVIESTFEVFTGLSDLSDPQDWGHAGPYLQFRLGGPKA